MQKCSILCLWISSKWRLCNPSLETNVCFILVNLISWPMNTFPCKADARITNEPKQRGLKIPPCWPGNIKSSCTRFSLEFFTVLALGSFHIQLCVWLGGVATEKSSCHLSGRLLLFAEKKMRWSETGQRQLFAVGKQTLSSVAKHSVAIVAWQLALIPWHCSVCSHWKLRSNVIHTLKLSLAVVLW